MYFPPNKYFGPKHTLQSSDSSAGTEFRIMSHFYSTLSNAAHCISPERRIDQRWRSIEADLVSFHWELGKGYFLGTHENVLRMLSTRIRCMNFAHMIYMQYPYNKLYSALRKIALMYSIMRDKGILSKVYVSIKNFLVMSGRVILGWTATKQRVKEL